MTTEPQTQSRPIGKDEAVEKRRVYEDVEKIRRRLGRLAGRGHLSPGAFSTACDLLDDLILTVGDDNDDTQPTP
jgi:hypothetical protein